MTIVHDASGTNVHEIAAGIYRISVPVPPSDTSKFSPTTS